MIPVTIRRGGRRSPARAGGFSLIEVLIALVVLAVGLLGLALLQTMNLRYTKSAQQRTQAITLAGQLLDMMRTNRSEIGAYAMSPSQFSDVSVPTSGCTRTAPATSASNIERWKCEVKEILGADATATVDVSSAPQVVVTVNWDESIVNNLSGSSGSVRLETTL